MLIAQEANAIEKAYFRLDLLPLESQPKLRQDFREYVRGRLAVMRKLPNMEAVNADLKQLLILQRKIWEETVDAAKESGPAAQMLVFSGLNKMIDTATLRTVAIISHLLVVVLLLLTVLLASFLTGHSMAVSGARDSCWFKPWREWSDECGLTVWDSLRQFSYTNGPCAD